ncbi:MAG: mannonate dehydratase [Planctomycetaceae bacterium]|jgi:mannonate dehydratase|nr:mannonate dehydratase [Planctomycetaceae bacterium]
MIPATHVDELPIRVGLGQFHTLSDSLLTYIKQCGVDDIQVNTPRLPGECRWEYEDLAAWREQVNAAGLRLMSLENVPVTFYDKILLGLPGREEQLDNMVATVRNMGRAGIPILGYHFMPTGVWRTSATELVRGGAQATRYEHSLAIAAGDDRYQHKNSVPPPDRDYTVEEMWANYDWYLERILPACEEAGVGLALHPDDPPVDDPLGRIPRLFHGFESFRRALDKFASPAHGLNFCHGCWSEMKAGQGVLEAIRHFGERKQIHYVHFRDVQGDVADFTECFLGEGNCDPVETIRTLKQVGFRGFLIPDHVPRMEGDTDWGHRGRGWTAGYIQGLLDAVAS